MIVILPFFLLIRGAVFIHSTYDLGPWISLLGGMIITSILLFIYMTIVYRWMTKKFGDVDSIQRRGLFALAMTVLYCIYGLFFFSADHIKSPSLRKEISDLHPIIRMASSTFILLDKSMIITDATRQPEDYRKMGLKTLKNSLHYPQKDGYAYAIDLRTNGHGEIRNRGMQLYFWLMGFRTLRHVGTADHLHVSLRNNDRPWVR